MDGALFSPYGCSAHKVHRIVVTACGEDRVLGDIHAVAFSASLTANRVALQNALWKLLGGLRISYDPPDPAWEQHKKAIFSHTMRRTPEHVRGALCDGEAMFAARGADEWDQLEMVAGRNHCVLLCSSPPA